VIRARTRKIIEAAIEQGIEIGYEKAHKHTDDPKMHHIKDMIEQAIWFNIDEVFIFEEETDE